MAKNGALPNSGAKIIYLETIWRTGAIAATTRGLDTQDVKHIVDCEKPTEVEE